MSGKPEETKPAPADALRARLQGSMTREYASWASSQTRERSHRSFEMARLEESPARRRAPDVTAMLRARLVDELTEAGLLDASDDEIAVRVERFVARVLEQEDLALNERERRGLVDTLAEEALGIGPLAPLMSDPAVTDILVNGPSRVFVERGGRLEETPIAFRDDAHLLRVIERIAARANRRIDAAQPMADLRLPDGSRVNATLPPISPDGPTLSIRRFGRHRLRARELERAGALSAPMREFLHAAVRHRQSILVSGGTGAGKSTLLGALAEAIPDHERVVTIEDTLELQLDQRHVVRLETRPPNVEGAGLVTQRELVVNALRMRPDRILVGEVRAGEALDMLQAMNTGHEGSLSTVHANSPRDALARLETLVLMAGIELPARAIREQIVSALDLLVHVERGQDGVRRVTHVAEITGLEGDVALLQDLFRFHHAGFAAGRVRGDFAPTGIVPRCVERLRERGEEMPLAWFERRPGRAARD
ncbi:MAG TPA: CpaF family protein [Myxococcota bacterium]|nr:CpaF family protein [Myxococcota bacterium]